MRGPHRPYKLTRTSGVTDSPPRHRMGFRHTVDGKGTCLQLRMERAQRRELETVVGDQLVNVIRQYPDMRVAPQDFDDLLVVRSAVRGTRGD